MKYVGIDYGTKKIGLSIGGKETNFAFPLSVVPKAEIFSVLESLIKKESIKAFVIGESLSTNGEQNDLSDQIVSFVEKLKMKFGLPVFLEREDFSSVEAHRYQTKKGDRDDSAAAIILQRFLDKNIK